MSDYEFFFKKQAEEMTKNLTDAQNLIFGLTSKVIEQKKEIAELKAENYKDEEIKRLDSKIQQLKEDLNRSFYITEEQDKKIQEFRKEHEKESHNEKHMTYTYIFYPSSIGMFGSIKCDKCGKEFTFQEAF